ncbi:DUF6112 family protein [Kitasatospora sp. NE20-6]|uniref:DUF6112 family protein n=1 Tax=Kitasatospora sp. NE20-6 TaxID=2859066 RepID=UPI0038B2C09D
MILASSEALTHLAYDPGVTPAEGGLPGLSVLKQVVSSINLFAVIATVGALCVSGVVWAWGHQSGSHGAEAKGKQGTLTAAGVALLLGAANGLVAFFSALGTQVK